MGVHNPLLIANCHYRDKNVQILGKKFVNGSHGVLDYYKNVSILNKYRINEIPQKRR
jgi:hypothetical protein